MKLKKHYLGYSKKLFSLALVMTLIITSIPSTFFTPVFADLNFDSKNKKKSP